MSRKSYRPLSRGTPNAAEQLLPLVYDELRKLAAQKLAQERPGQTLQATALVHEAYIRLVDVDQIQHWDCRGHFFDAAAEAMRRILIDQARRKRSEKRGGTMRRVELDACALLAPPQNHAADDLRALDEALRQLEAEDPIKVALTMAGLILLIVVTLAGSIGWFAGDRAARWAAVERQVDLALQEATQLMEQARWPEARAWLERADGLLAGGGSRDEVRQRVSALRNDLDLVQRLEEVRMEKAAVLDGDMTYAEVDSRYAQAFGDYGIDLDEPGADGVAERIRQSAVCTELAAMIDDWAMVRRRARGSGELGSRNPRWPYPSARWVKECERLVELDGKLAAVLSGEQPVSDAAERIEYADLCYKKRRFAAAARFFEQALAEKPELAEDPRSFHRYNAACCAALAASSQGDDAASLDDARRDGWRQQALDWLRADLNSCRKLLESGSADARAKVVSTLKHWQTDPDLAGVRDPDVLAKLSVTEQNAWRALWTDVESLCRPAVNAPPQGRPVDGE